jgi:ligand-binding SRPBCC domain-containing protein
MRMTVPRAMRGRTIADVRAGKHLGRSWFLLGGVVPFDFDDITIAELEPGRRFLERSTMWSFRHWSHERVLEAERGGCALTDRISFEPRAPQRFIPGYGRLLRAGLRWFFRHRHRRLARHLAKERGLRGGQRG